MEAGGWRKRGNLANGSRGAQKQQANPDDGMTRAECEKRAQLTSEHQHYINTNTKRISLERLGSQAHFLQVFSEIFQQVPILCSCYATSKTEEFVDASISSFWLVENGKLDMDSIISSIWLSINSFRTIWLNIQIKPN